MKIQIPPAKEQLDVLIRGTADLHSEEDLEKLLDQSHRTQKPLTIKTGFDPTAADLHLGHTVLMEKMAQFQRFGHEVIFLIGDYTALIGDPTGRNMMRPPLTEAQIKENATTYTDQCWKILDRERTNIQWNSKWLSKLGFNDMIILASKYNLGRMLERRDFKTRFQNNQQIALHELLYPLIQAYDSVALGCDVELGGHDQIFNLNVGRQMMAAYDLKPQVVLTVHLLVGLDGVDKMSKSKGNHVGIVESPEKMFGKIMSISDETMWKWIPLLTGRAVDKQEHPLESKKQLAADMVARFHGQASAEKTATWWDAGRPLQNQEVSNVESAPLFKVVQKLGAAKSGSDARRKIEQGGVSLDGERQTDPMAVLAPGTYQIKVGKKWASQIKVH